MEGLELVCFQMIASVGTAKSMFIEAMQLARQKRFDEAEDLISKGEREVLNAHKVHAELIAKEANGKKTDVSLLLLHAEDQFMSSETIKIVAQELIEVYRSR